MLRVAGMLRRCVQIGMPIIPLIKWLLCSGYILTVFAIWLVQAASLLRKSRSVLVVVCVGVSRNKLLMLWFDLLMNYRPDVRNSPFKRGVSVDWKNMIRQHILQ